MAKIAEVKNWGTPYISRIPVNQLTTGKLIFIQGRLPGNSNGFGVNLALGYARGEDRSDTAFHFNVRIDANNPVVVRNTRANGEWGIEETDGGMPFQAGTAFQMKIYCGQQRYEVTIDGNLFCYYEHRTPLANVEVITIEGNVEIDEVLFI